MTDTTASYDHDMPPALTTVPTIFPTSPPIEELMGRFWDSGPELDSVEIYLEPPEVSLALLEKLGPSPFQRGGFPLVGFLATTYEKVSRYALQRR